MDLLSLIGLLQHCTQAIPIGRPSLGRLIDRAHSVKELYHFVRLSVWEMNDTEWWRRLILYRNGRSLSVLPKREVGSDFSFTSDAAGVWGLKRIWGKDGLRKHGPQY